MTTYYDDIIDLPHHEPSSVPRMSMQARAAQFAPFAALEGHERYIQREQHRQQGE